MEEQIRTQLKEEYGVTDISKYGVMHLGRDGVRTIIKLKAWGICPKCKDEISIQVLFDEKCGAMVSEDYRCFTCNPRQEGE